MADKGCVLLFSGGRDSSLACVELAKKGYDLHLLTFDNGAVMNLDQVNYRYKELERLFPNRVKHNLLLPSYGLFKEIALIKLEEDFSKYNTNLICLGCKLAMHVLSLAYCLRNDIHTVADGYTEYQREYMEQMPEAIEETKKLHAEFGVEYLNPVYEIKDVNEVKRSLLAAGLSTRSMEGTCLFGDTFSVPSTEKLIGYMKEKAHICRSFLNDFLRKGELLQVTSLGAYTVNEGGERE